MDEKCEVISSFLEFEYLCCCYTNGEKCQIGSILNQDLICPRLKFNNTIDTDNLNVKVPPVRTDVDIDDMLSNETSDHECHINLALWRINRTSEAQLNFDYSAGSMCNKTLYEVKYEGCRRAKRLCLDNMHPQEMICCKFARKSWIQKGDILSTHKNLARFLYYEFKVSYVLS